MKYSFRLLVLCINCSLLSLFVGRSDGGIGSLCDEGKFFDRSKQQYVSCRECKNEIQDCFSCCKTDPHNPVERNNGTNLSSSNRRLQPQNFSGPKRQTEQISSSSKRDEVSPNMLVVSTISFFILASLLIVLAVIVKSSARCDEEANDRTPSESQRSDIVTVMMMEPVSESTDASSHSDGQGTDRSQTTSC